MNFEHPSTFDTMAMNDELKRSVMGDQSWKNLEEELLVVRDTRDREV